MKKIWVSFAMILLSSLVVGCGPVSLETSHTPSSTGPVTSKIPTSSNTPTSSVNPVSLLNLLKSDKQRDLLPNITTSELTSLANGNSAFAWDLYQQLKAEQGNLFFSPYSLSLALAMAYAGARGETATQMADTLYFTLAPDKLAKAFNHVAWS
jgi:hypothetical protein